MYVGVEHCFCLVSVEVQGWSLFLFGIWLWVRLLFLFGSWRSVLFVLTVLVRLVCAGRLTRKITVLSGGTLRQKAGADHARTLAN